MDFRTELKLQPAVNQISIHHPVMTIGSCFSDEIGARFQSNKFSVLQNPFGTVYNPISIQKLIGYALLNTRPSPDSYLQLEDQALNFDFHSSFTGHSTNALEERINQSVHHTFQFLRKAHWLIITYGTAWVFERKDTGIIVGNCHKVPASLFTKRLLTVDEVVTSFSSIHKTIQERLPSCRVILTLSPVRHIKDTLEGNSVSKAIVRSAIHEICNTFSSTEYFPSYEIMMDDLRDYRFYKEDLIHPNDMATSYIWDHFAKRYFDKPTEAFLTQWKSIRAALEHRPFRPEAPAHQRFLKEVLLQLEELKTTVDVSKETELLRRQLI